MRPLTANEAQSQGILLEVNRRELHPRGLALGAYTNHEKPEDEHTFALTLTASTLQGLRDLVDWARPELPEWNEFFDTFENVLTNAEEKGPRGLFVLNDYEDEEGVVFGDFDETDLVKRANYDKLLLPKREQALGFVVEPLPDEVT